jgi:hypothetical protein
MRDWIIIFVSYAFGTGFFHLVGGVGAASDAITDWARSRTHETNTLTRS